MVCILRAMNNKHHPQNCVDGDLIHDLGGATALARRLTASAKRRNRLEEAKAFTPQRVQNWRSRGIPALVRLNYAAVLRKPSKAKGA
jgi:ethanolamine ammonia-lyase small subunit